MYLHIVCDGALRLVYSAIWLKRFIAMAHSPQQFGQFKLDMSWKNLSFIACSGEPGSIRHCSGAKVPWQAGVYKSMDVYRDGKMITFPVHGLILTTSDVITDFWRRMMGP